MQASNTLIMENPERFQMLLSNIQTYIPSWKSVSFGDVTFSRLTGFTNITYKVKVVDPETKIEPKILVYREFCAHENFFSRKEEAYIFSDLGKQGLGPKTYGGDNLFRLEEFITGRHPDVEMMNSRLFNLCLVKFAVGFHKVDLEGLLKSPNCMGYLEKKRPYSDFFKITDEFKKRVTEAELEMINTLREFVNDHELEFMKKKLKEIDGKVVFCHNDLNANNIFLRESGLDLNNAIIFIDFEYCSYNFRGYDIGNFLIERTFDYNYEKPPYFFNDFKNYPEDDFIKELATFYTFFDLIYPLKMQFDLKIFDATVEELMDLLIKNKCVGNLDEFLKNVEKMVWEIRIGTLVSLFYWILWSGSICQDPNIKFNYLEHGIKRMEIYIKLKKKWFE